MYATQNYDIIMFKKLWLDGFQPNFTKLLCQRQKALYSHESKDNLTQNMCRCELPYSAEDDALLVARHICSGIGSSWLPYSNGESVRYLGVEPD